MDLYGTPWRAPLPWRFYALSLTPQAKPFHPVFLDVLEFATTKLMRQRDDATVPISDTDIVSPPSSL